MKTLVFSLVAAAGIMTNAQAATISATGDFTVDGITDANGLASPPATSISGTFEFTYDDAIDSNQSISVQSFDLTIGSTSYNASDVGGQIDLFSAGGGIDDFFIGAAPNGFGSTNNVSGVPDFLASFTFNASGVLVFQLVNYVDPAFPRSAFRPPFNPSLTTLNISLSEVAPVPLPASLPLLAAALGGIGIAARRRKSV